MATDQSTPYVFTLPDLLAKWPFKTEPNPRDDIMNDSKEWVETYNAFGPKAQDAFNRCKFGLFGAYAYPHADGVHYRTCVDLMNIFFVYDEFSDRSNGEEVRQQAKDIMDAMRYPHDIPEGGDSILGAMYRSFWHRTMEIGTKSSMERFIRNFDIYTDAVRQEAVDRDEHRIRSIKDYFELRRGTIGVHPSYDYFLMNEDIPDECIDHPHVQKLACAGVDMTILANDLYSYNVEQARDEDSHNLVAVTMREKNLGVQEAMDHIGEMYDDMRTKFCEDFENIPYFSQYSPEVNELVHKWCWYVGNWVTTNIMWSHLGERYFGKAGMEVLKHRTVTLLPKQKPAEATE